MAKETFRVTMASLHMPAPVPYSSTHVEHRYVTSEYVEAEESLGRMKTPDVSDLWDMARIR